MEKKSVLDKEDTKILQLILKKLWKVTILIFAYCSRAFDKVDFDIL